LITSLAWLGGCHAEHAPPPEDRAPSALRTLLSPEPATDPDIKTLVGTEYHIGAGADQDLPRAADLPGTDVEGDVTERACDLVDVEACRGIGWWHASGEEGCTKDVALASAHFIKGCDKGAATSCIDMASLQDWAQSGFGEDKAPARKFYKRACYLNDPMGCELREEPQARGPEPQVPAFSGLA
jgi:TPR repeat protein